MQRVAPGWVGQDNAASCSSEAGGKTVLGGRQFSGAPRIAFLDFFFILSAAFSVPDPPEHRSSVALQESGMAVGHRKRSWKNTSRELSGSRQRVETVLGCSMIPLCSLQASDARKNFS